MQAPDLSTILVKGTPIEQHDVAGVTVAVKRDDKCNTHEYLPNITKLRALIPTLLDYKAQGIKKVAVYSTRVSRMGWATAVLCKWMGLACTVYYPVFMGQDNKPLLSVVMAQQAGAKTVALFVKDSMVNHYSKADNMAGEAEEVILPYGLTTKQALMAYRDEAATIPLDYVAGGTVVGCAGSGATITGIWLAMPASTTVYGVQVGSKPSLACGAINGKPPVRVVKSAHMYYNTAKAVPPFTADCHYDAKAWEWLTEHIHELAQPVLFYNMG